jgi:hypothetical protein
VANHAIITTTIDAGNGKALQQKVHGVFTYHVNEEGKLLALRGYWEVDDPRNTMIEIDIDEDASVA